MKLVDNYIDSSPRRDLMTKLHLLLIGHDKLKVEFKWNMPVYTIHGKEVCYLKDTKHGVNIGFTKGSTLTSSSNLLEGTGKEMRHIKLSTLETFEESRVEIDSLIEKAINLEA